MFWLKQCFPKNTNQLDADLLPRDMLLLVLSNHPKEYLLPATCHKSFATEFECIEWGGGGKFFTNLWFGTITRRWYGKRSDITSFRGESSLDFFKQQPPICNYTRRWFIPQFRFAGSATGRHWDKEVERGFMGAKVSQLFSVSWESTTRQPRSRVTNLYGEMPQITVWGCYREIKIPFFKDPAPCCHIVDPIKRSKVKVRFLVL